MGKLGSRSPRRPEVSQGRTGPGGRAIKRAVASSELCSVVIPARPESGGGVVEEPTLLRQGEGLGGSGKDWGSAPEPSSRRMGDGTRERIVDRKQGRSWSQPRSGRRAKTRCISSEPVKSARGSKIGGSGRSSDEARDNTTLVERRSRGHEAVARRAGGLGG